MNWDWMNFIGVISFIIGLAALIFSFVQTKQSYAQTDKLHQHSKSLLSIADSLSTRYIGQFPEYLNTVVKIIEQASTEVRIIKTNPIQAYFTDPTSWVNYSQVIERKAQSGVTVSITTLSEQQRRNRLKLQFPKNNEEWLEFKKKNELKLKHFLKFRFPKLQIDDINHESFIDLLSKTQIELLNEAFRLKGVNVIELDQPIHLQAWVVDAKQAVFTIQTLPLSTISHAFISSDARIVSALHAMTELFMYQNQSNMNLHPRIDFIVVTSDLDKSISFYRDMVGLEMRLLSNPVAIFKYDYASLYIYKDSFFREQFGIDESNIAGSGMISIEINLKDSFNELVSRFTQSPDGITIIKQSEHRCTILDFNKLVIEFWYNYQKDLA